jgi:CHAT domain-containing protein
MKFLSLLALNFLLALTALCQDEKAIKEFQRKAGVAANTGKYDSVDYYYGKAIALSKSQSSWSNYLLSTIFRADNLINWGKYEEGIRVAHQAETESEQWFGIRNYYQGLAMEMIGNGEAKKGNYQNAIDQYWDAELIFMKNENWRSQLAALYNATGNAFREKGAYSHAIDYFNKAKSQNQNAGDEINATVARFNIAACYVMQQKYDLAINEYETATRFFKEKLGEGHPAFASIYNNTGAAIFYQGKNYPLALEYYVKATELKKQQVGEQHLDVARGYFNQGWVYEEMKVWSNSESNYLKAENILQALFKAGHPLAAWTFNRHGQLLAKQKKFGEAIQKLDEGERQNVRLLKGEKIYLDKVRAIETYKFKSTVYYSWYKSTKSIEHLKNSLKCLLESEALMQQASRQTLKEADRLEFAKLSRNIFETGAEVSYELNRISKDPAYLEQYFHFSERGKALVLNQALEEAQALQFADVPDTLIRKEKEYRQYTAEFTQKLLSFDPAKQSPTELNQIEETLFYLSGLNKLLTEQIETDFPKYYELKYHDKGISLQELQQQLPAGTTLFSYMITDSLLFVSSITSQSVDITPVAITSEALEKLITGFRSAILFQQRDFFVPASAKLFSLLFPKGISPSAKSITIIPDNRLAKIPFEALLVKTPPVDSDYHSMDFLITRVGVSYSNSAQLFWKHSKSKTFQSNYGLLALAPVFEDGKTNSVNLRTQSLLTETGGSIESNGKTRGQLFNGNAIRPLPATAEEISSLYKLFDTNKQKAELVLGPIANERKLKSAQSGAFKYIHIATHGFVNEESPELSGLLLAQDTTDHDEDNILYMGEMYNLKLNADLVTLSACETGLGKIIKGEGVVGLTRALTYAGARNIVVSLWKVNDASTAELMINFYKSLLYNERAGIAFPLQQAKIKMIKEGKYADPYYWSAFVLLGK